MAHADAIAGRLPELYRDGELVRGVVGAPALQVEIVDESRLEVQRAHWFDTTLELTEAARIAAVLDFVPAPWHDLTLFRIWIHRVRDAMVETGAVTRRALTSFVAAYAADVERAVGVRVAGPLATFGDQPSSIAPAFVENPVHTVWADAGAAVEPLQQFTLTTKGLDPVEAALLLVGLPTGPECAPVIVNLTTGQALLFLGTIPPGQRLFIRPDGHGGVTARLEGQDVTSRLYSVTGVTPGTPWTRANVESPPRALRLQRGDNAMWFLPVAHYEVRGLDRFLLALPDLTLAEARYDTTTFDQALFYEQPAIVLRAAWREARPASFEVYLPGGLLLGEADKRADALAARTQLEDALGTAVATLRAAAVESRVLMRAFADAQGSGDRLTAVLPIRVRERGPMGADRRPDQGGVFEVTRFEESTFR
jgi:hypothetical protein